MDVLKALKRASKNEYASKVSDGTIADVDAYIDTGNYLLNGQLSGSMLKGIPNNKSICFSGQSTTGKTFLVIEASKLFLLSSHKNYLIWFASEKGISKDIIDRALSCKEENEESIVKRLAEERIKVFKGLPKLKAKKRLYFNMLNSNIELLYLEAILQLVSHIDHRG